MAPSLVPLISSKVSDDVKGFHAAFLWVYQMGKWMCIMYCVLRIALKPPCLFLCVYIVYCTVGIVDLLSWIVLRIAHSIFGTSGITHCLLYFWVVYHFLCVCVLWIVYCGLYYVLLLVYLGMGDWVVWVCINIHFPLSTPITILNFHEHVIGRHWYKGRWMDANKY